jgi:hypothetical protein
VGRVKNASASGLLGILALPQRRFSASSMRAAAPERQIPPHSSPDLDTILLAMEGTAMPRFVQRDGTTEYELFFVVIAQYSSDQSTHGAL